MMVHLRMWIIYGINTEVVFCVKGASPNIVTNIHTCLMENVSSLFLIHHEKASRFLVVSCFVLPLIDFD